MAREKALSGAAWRCFRVAEEQRQRGCYWRSEQCQTGLLPPPDERIHTPAAIAARPYGWNWVETGSYLGKVYLDAPMLFERINSKQSAGAGDVRRMAETKPAPCGISATSRW